MLQYVGGAMGSGVASGILSVSLTALSGGFAGTTLAAQSGDIVIAACAEASNTNPDTGVSGSAGETFTELFDIVGVDSANVNLSVNYRYLTGGETAVNCFGQSNISWARVGLVHVWRNVDDTTQMDVSATGASGGNTGRPSPPAITPTTPGVVVLTVGAGSNWNAGVGLSNFTPPTGYAYNMVGHRSGINVSGSGVTAAIFARYWPGFGTETPGAYTSGSAAAQAAWGAVTVALRPRQCNSDFFTSQDSG